MALSTKSFAISKREVFEAWKCVKANRGAAGIDGQSIASFEANLSSNLYKLWNRLASGSYFPPAVKAVEIPKQLGGKRQLGIPTVSDRIAQTVVKQRLELELEPYFDKDSYGYRPGKSALQAVRVTQDRCWNQDWVVEFDIKGAFDNLDHALLKTALRKHTACRWVLLYIDRWLTVPTQNSDGEVSERTIGTPQGGVIGPLLMNVFMHYAFDKWMRRKINCEFARFADDAVIHCRSQKQAEWVVEMLQERFAQCGLELNHDKTRIVYCCDSKRSRCKSYPNISFTFLGFTFRPRRARRRSDGGLFTRFLAAASNEACKRMRQRIRKWRIPRQAPAPMEEFSEFYNPILRGWWNYYGKFYPSIVLSKVFRHFDLTLALWARRKFKRFIRHKRRSLQAIDRFARRHPNMFVHWSIWHRNGLIVGAV